MPEETRKLCSLKCSNSFVKCFPVWSPGTKRLLRKQTFLSSQQKMIYTVIIRINAAAFINFFVVKVRRLFEGGVYSRAALIAHFVKTTVNL